jgi:DNA-binding response OmpR family regulator
LLTASSSPTASPQYQNVATHSIAAPQLCSERHEPYIILNVPIHFYLTFAKSDARINTECVKRFFEDLSDLIRNKLGLTYKESVGFFDRRESETSEWAGQLAETLRTSRTLVCLTSPAFFRDERAGKEWQLFQARIERHTSLMEFPLQELQTKHSVILPVTWIPAQNVPTRIERVLHSGPEYSNPIYRAKGMLAMLKSMGTFRHDYGEVVNAVAERLIDASEAVNLLPLEELPAESQIQNAFAYSSTESHLTTSSLVRSTKLKVFIVDDDAQVREFVVEACRFSGFEAYGYDEAERALEDIFQDPSLKKMPDLFVVDLELKPSKMQGLELINELAERNAPPAILAISGNHPSGSLLRAIEVGALATSAKPFDLHELIKQITYCATIGRNRRLYRETDESFPMDSSRQHRPVFLSYAKEDKRAANGLRVSIEARNIGVWYAPTTLQLGEDWRNLIQAGIDQARIFVALITESYLNSPICVAELSRFYQRLENEVQNPPILVPVLYGSPDIVRNNNLISASLQRYQYVHMSPERIVDAYTVILLRVQRAANVHL